MKLYTEEQVNKIALQVKDNGYYNHLEITPIELPSDEEIEKNNPYEYLVGSKYYSPQNLKYWEEGAKWVIEQIKQEEK